MNSNNPKVVSADAVSGVTVIDGNAYGSVAGMLFPVVGAVRNRDGSYIPVLDIPFMDESPRKEGSHGE